MIPGYRSETEKTKANTQRHCWIGHRQLIVDSVGYPECFSKLFARGMKGGSIYSPVCVYHWSRAMGTYLLCTSGLWNFEYQMSYLGIPHHSEVEIKLCTTNLKGGAIIVWDPAQRLRGSSCHNSDSRRQGREGLKWVSRFLRHRSRSLRLQYTWHIWGMKGRMSVALSWSGQGAGTRYIGVCETELRNLIHRGKSAYYQIR